MNTHVEFKTFGYRLDPEDIVKRGLTEFRPVGANEYGYYLKPVEGGPTILLEHQRFCEELRNGHIEYKRSVAQRQSQQSPAAATSDKLISLLPRKTLAQARRRALWVAAVNEEKAHLEANGVEQVKLSRSKLKSMMPAIRLRIQ
jgi:hypothetical protein